MSDQIAPDREVVVGLDAGGSAVRARAVAGGRVVFEGQGGPGNPLSTEPEALASSYLAALAGCPEPSHVAACVSGAGGPRQRARIAGLLADRFPHATAEVVPDYVAALLAAPDGTDVVVIAGTGSVVCSPAAGGRAAVSGGRGWILGDRGSASRLGQAALEWFCEEPDADPEAAARVRACLGLTEWRQIVSALSASANPSALLARAAPVLTQAAERGSHWAVAKLDAEMGALAATTARHIGRYFGPGATTRIALAGGVWTSDAARAAFAAALTSNTMISPVITNDPLDPLAGAVRLASKSACEQCSHE